MLINIQFLRFAAALLVVLYHASMHVRATGVDQGAVFAAAEAVGFAGVDIFFVISGFIMFYTTTGSTGPRASLDFFKRRAARIYSGYWPFFLLAAVVFAWARPEHFAEASLWTSFLLWPMPLNQVLLDVSWTLSYEMYFYVLFSALVLLTVRWRWQLLVVILTLVAGYNLLNHFIFHRYSPELYYYNSFEWLFYTAPYLAEFFAGSVLASFAHRGSQRLGWSLLLWGIAGFAAAGMANVFWYDGKIEQGFHVVPRVILFGVPSVMMLWGLVSLESHGRVAPERFSLATGGASYAIYLVHTIAFVATMKLGIYGWMEGWTGTAVQLAYLAYAALIVVYGVVHYRTLERWLHRVFKRALGVSGRP